MTHPLFALCKELGISPLSLHCGGGERGDFYVPLHNIGAVPDIFDIKEKKTAGAFLNLYMSDLWFLRAVDAMFYAPSLIKGAKKVPQDRLSAENECLMRVAEYTKREVMLKEHTAPALCRCDAVLYLSKPSSREIRANDAAYENSDASFYIYSTYKMAKDLYELAGDDAGFCPDGTEKPLLCELLMTEPDIYRVAEGRDASVFYRRAIKIADLFLKYYHSGGINKQDKLVMCNLTAKGLEKILYFMGAVSYNAEG